MEPIIPVIAVVLVALLLVGLAFVWLMWKKKGQKKMPVDYYTFFIIGIVWVAMGILLGNFGLAAVGVVFMALGLANRSKWKENKECWGCMGPGGKKSVVVAAIILGLLILGGVAVVLISRGVL